jgi:hypothetical protein
VKHNGIFMGTHPDGSVVSLKDTIDASARDCRVR